MTPAVERRKITIRMAKTDEGEKIHQLCLAGGMWEITNLDWSQFGGFWWVGEADDELVGCIQCLPGFPVSHCEFFFLHSRLSKRDKVLVTKDLTTAAMTFLGQLGAQAISGCVPDHNSSWSGIAKKHECTEWYHGTMMLRRVWQRFD